MLSFRPLSAEDVEVRVAQVGQSKVQLLLYKTARIDMALLDETIGPENWQCRYDQIDGKLFCDVGIRFKDGEWVWKQDVGVPSNMESQKGEASDAFKRACFKWGIGRELYTAPDIWVPRSQCKQIKKGRSGKEQCYDDFKVTEMTVSDGRIASLQICNMSNNGIVVYGPKEKRAPARKHNRFAKLTSLMTDASGLGCSKEGMQSHMNANILQGIPLKECSDEQLSECEQYVSTLIADQKALGNG